MKRQLVGIGMLPLSFIAFAAGAAATGDSTGDSAEGFKLQEVVVTARRIEESAQKTPVAITTLSANELVNKVIQNATDLGKETPSLGIRVSSVAPAGLYFGLRGQASTDVAASAGSPVGVYLDDIYLSSAPIAGAVLNLDDLQQIEILKGPQGTLYGRNVTGGLIKFETAKPKLDTFEGYATVGGGNYERFFVEGMINLPIGDTVALRMVASTDDHSGYSHDPIHDRDLDNQRKWNFRGSVLFRPTDDLSITAQGWLGEFRNNGTDTRMVYIAPGVNIASMAVMAHDNINGINAGTLAPLILCGGLTAPDPTRGCSQTLFDAVPATYATAAAALPAVQAAVNQQINAPRNQAVQDGNLLLGDHARQAGGALTFAYTMGNTTFKSITGYDYASRNGHFNVGGGPWMLIYTDQNALVQQFTEELQATGTAFDGDLKYAAGLYFLNSDIDDNRQDSAEHGAFPYLLGDYGLGLTAGNTALNKLNTKSYAGYSQATYAITSTVNLTGGVRYTKEKEEIRERTVSGSICLSPLPFSQSTPIDQCGFATASNSDSSVSYTAGVDWSVMDNVMLYAKTGRGFKAGGVNGFAPDGAPIGTFKPELNTDYEAGVKSQFWNNRLRVNADYYHTNYSDIQRTVSINIGTPSVPRIVSGERNAAKAKIDGVETEITALLFDALTLRATGAYTDARYTEYLVPYNADANRLVDLSGLKFQGIPKIQYSLSAGYDISTGWSKIHTEVVWSYRGDTSLFEADHVPSTLGGSDFSPDSVTTQKAYGLLDASISLDLDSLHSKITLWGKNLTDKLYYSSVIGLNNNGVPATFANYGAPRTFGGDWTVRF